jgi:hypothetical protein
MARILKAKPSPHGAAGNPQVGIVDPSIHTHTDKQEDRSSSCRATRGVGEPLQSVCDKVFKGSLQGVEQQSCKAKKI